MWILVFVTVVLCCFIYIKIFKPLNFWKNKNVVYEKPMPLFGNYGQILLKTKHFCDIQADIYYKHPNDRYVGIFQFTEPFLMIRDLDLIKQLFIKDFDHFTDHTMIVLEDADPIMSKNLFVMKGNTWRQMRATLSPVFTSAKIRNMFNLMRECSDSLKNNIKNDKDIVEYNIKDLFSRFTNDVIASTAFGIKCDSIRNPNNDFYINAKKFTTFSGFQNFVVFLMTLFPKLINMLKISIFKPEQVNYFHNIILDAMRQREAENIIRPDLIHLLMEARKGKLVHENPFKDSDAGFATVEESEIGKSDEFKKTEWSDDEITAQALLFFFAGFETVASTSAFMAYELAVNTDIQDKLHNEIDNLFEQTEGKIQYDDVVKMKYLDQVIAETLRKWTQAFQTDRMCSKDYTIKAKSPTEKDVIINAGTTVFVPIMAIHKNPEYFPNPNKFDPERFNEENKKHIIPGTYMPFGIGPRNCIGSRFALIELKILFIYLLAKFDIVPTSKTQIPYKINPAKLNLSPDLLFLGFKLRNVTNL